MLGGEPDQTRLHGTRGNATTGEGHRRIGPAAPAQYLSDESMNPAEIVAEEDWTERSMAQLRSALTQLDERSQEILRLRWLNEPKVTLQELATQYGISAERVRQIEAKAMKKLRSELAPA